MNWCLWCLSDRECSLKWHIEGNDDKIKAVHSELYKIPGYPTETRLGGVVVSNRSEKFVVSMIMAEREAAEFRYMKFNRYR